MKDPSRKFNCPVPGCGKLFGSGSNLSRHKTTFHLAISRYSCHRCEKTFKRSDVLQRHLDKVHLEFNRLPKTFQKLPESKPLPDNIETSAKPQEATVDSNKNISIPTELAPSSDVYNWISDIALDSESAISSSVFDQNDIGWLFTRLDAENVSSRGIAQIPERGHLQADRKLQFSPLPDFMNTLMDSNLQTSTNLPNFQTPPTHPRDESLESWLLIERKIKEVLFDQHDGHGSTIPRLTLSNVYSQKLVDCTFFEATTMKRLYYLYFEVFHDHFPILHKSSFIQYPQKVEPLLIVSILTLGAYHDTEENYNTAVELHERLRWLIFSQDLIPPQLWAIQTLALIQLFEKMASTRHQHEVSATFHSAVITLLRRDGSCANMRPVNRDEVNSLLKEWELWIERESIKRCVLFLFMMDAQHSLLFGHTSFMSATEIRLDLPCSDELWNSCTVQEWSRRITELSSSNIKQLDNSFVDTLRSLLNEKLLPLHLSPFSKLCVLHGLLSVIWHTQQSDPGSLGVNRPSRSFQTRRQILEKAIETWSFSIMGRTSSLATDVARVMYRTAFIILYTSQSSVLDLLTFCGSASLIGRPLRSIDFLKSKESVENWVKSEDANQGFIHALFLIHHIVFSGNAIDGTTGMYKLQGDKLALRPWCLYIATLVVWVYSFFKLKQDGTELKLSINDPVDLQTSFLRAEEFVVTSLKTTTLNEKSAGTLLDQPQPSIPIRDSLYLLIVVRDSLKNCRWEMIRDAHTCLGKLIGLDRDI